MDPNCVACGTARSGPYCAACGQREWTGRHTMRSLTRGVVDRVVNVDGGLVHTVYRLSVRPGATIRDYLRGSTVRYTHPAGYLLVAIAVFALISRLFSGSTGAPEGDRVFALLVIPFVAAASRLLFWRARYNYAEHLIVVMYLFGHVVMVLAALYIVVPFLGESASRIFAIAALSLGASFIVWAYSRVFPERPLLAAVGGAAALILGLTGWTIALVLLVGWLRT